MSLPGFIDGPDGLKVLPPGRHSCTVAEVHACFVAGRPDEAHRQRLFDDWQAFWDQQLAHKLAVIAHWVDGSFTSDKVMPNDIDFSSLIDGTVMPKAGYESWLSPGPTWKTCTAPIVNRLLLVDAYAVVKVPDAAPDAQHWLAARGKWDDWWQRSRVTGEALAKGYLEVRR